MRSFSFWLSRSHSAKFVGVALILCFGTGALRVLAEDEKETPRRKERPANIVVYSTVFEDGKNFPAPTEEKPQYYILAQKPYDDGGRANDRPPASDYVDKLVRAALAKAHYLQATSDSPQIDVAIVSFLGAMNRSLINQEGWNAHRFEHARSAFSGRCQGLGRYEPIRLAQERVARRIRFQPFLPRAPRV
jgi:hypothetical protein